MLESSLLDLEGCLESIVFQNEETHYCVAKFFVSSSREVITVRGTLIDPRVGETLRITGEWQEDPRFGLQFKVKYFQPLTPKTLDGIRKFLGSGMIPGIGPHLADKIVDHFGLDTFVVIEKSHQRLSEVEGIGASRVQTIVENWVDHKIARDATVFLRGHGLGDALAAKVFQHYGPATIEKVQEDPYSMTRDIRGVGFRTADSLALGLGFGSSSSSRLRAGILHCLQEWQGNGHCAIKIPVLIEQASKLLDVSADQVQMAMDLCLQEEEIQITGDLVQEKMLCMVEKQISMRVATLLYTDRQNNRSHLSLDMEKLSSLQRAFPEIILSEEQHETLRRAVSNSLSVITGGPGVGKTTILKILTYLFVSSGCKVKLCAPTGKAARRMESVTKHTASTLHKLLQYKGAADFAANEENPLEGDVFIVDEASMLDIWLFYALLKALPADATLILVGDVDQLPSVGPGHVLRDLIETSLVPVSYLSQIFRQQKASGIIAAAHSVNRGFWVEPLDVSDFFFIEADNPKRVQDLLLKMLLDRIPKRYGLHPVLDIQVLAPMYKGDAGIEALNRILQETLNPHEPDVLFGARNFRAGDKVMQLENNYDKEVFNGDQGMIEGIDSSAQQMAVRFEDRVLVYTRSEIEELSLCYAASVHKVQGSEFSAVILVLMNSHYTMLKRNLVYTAITRGKNLVIVLGQKRALLKAVEDTTGQSRITLLQTRIRDLIANLES